MTSVDWTGLASGVLDDLFGGDDAPTGPDFGDRYEVRDPIGKGGQGIVYGAFDRILEREVAIKRLHDPGSTQMPLRNEARILGRLAHAAIPQIYDQGRSPDGGWFVVMQRIDGLRLHKALEQWTFDLPARLRLFRTIAAGVLHAHQRGILHRDLKPENIIVSEEGDAWIIDWGLAANGGPRAICGSPHFAAPEQLQGQVADRRVDVYALGVLLYAILCGELPYGRSVKNFNEFRRLRAGLEKVPLRKRAPELPASLERLCETAMAAQPAARYATVADLMRDLDAVQAGRPLARDLPRMPWQRLGVLSMAAGGLLCIGAGLATGYLLSGDDGAGEQVQVLQQRIAALKQRQHLRRPEEGRAVPPESVATAAAPMPALRLGPEPVQVLDDRTASRAVAAEPLPRLQPLAQFRVLEEVASQGDQADAVVVEAAVNEAAQAVVSQVQEGAQSADPALAALTPLEIEPLPSLDELESQLARDAERSGSLSELLPELSVDAEAEADTDADDLRQALRLPSLSELEAQIAAEERAAAAAGQSAAEDAGTTTD